MTWIQDFFTWLRDVLGIAEQSEPAPIEVLTAQGGECKAYLLFCDRDAPVEGVVEIWLLHHDTSATRDCLIILVNVAQIRESYGPAWDLDAPLFPKPWRRAFEVKAKAELVEQREIDGTHLFLVGWVSKTPVASRFSQGKVVKFRAIECQRVYLVDLLGALYYLGVNEPARRIVRAMVKRAIAIPPGTLNIWENYIFYLGEPESKTTWLTWMEHYSRKIKGTHISDDHILQPRKSKLRRRKSSGDR